MEAKIEISASLWERLAAFAQARGCASPQEYITQLIERELAKESPSTDAEVTRKMEELGYLDFGRDI